MSRQQPRSVSGAIWVLGGLVALSGLTALLTVLFRDDMVRAWATGHPDETGVKAPSFVPVAIVLFVVFALLAGVLTMFFLSGHNWARLALTGLAAFMAIATLAGLRTGPPAVFVVVSVVAVVLDAALVFFLWHRDTSAYIRDLRLGAHSDTPGSRQV
jgi:hypothetical protein